MAAAVPFAAFMRAAASSDEAFFELANAPVVRYEVAAGKHMEITQDTSLHDCCGGIIWETSFALSQYLRLHLPHRTAGRKLSELKVVELGAGCGLLGLSLAAAFACSAVITDVEQVLPLVRGNVQRNLPQLPQPPRVMPLDWQSAADLRAVVAHGPFDVLVATDVVFAERLVVPLLDCVSALCRAPSSTQPPTLVFVCLQERSPEAFKLFMTLVAQRFEVTRVPTADLEFADDECVLLELRCGHAQASGSDGDTQPRSRLAAHSDKSHRRRRRSESHTHDAPAVTQQAGRSTSAGDAEDELGAASAKKAKKKRKGMLVQ